MMRAAAAMFLAMLLLGGCRPEYRGRPPDPEPFAGWRELILYGTQTASSTLGGEDWEADVAPAFSMRNLGDGDPADCWAEGAPGPGLGQRIYLSLSLQPRPDSLAVVNGWARDEKTYLEHGRIKTFRATLLHAMHLEGDYIGAGERFLCLEYREARQLNLADTRDRQALPLDFDWDGVDSSSQGAARAFEREFGERIAARARQTGGEGFGRVDVLCLEITEVYPGTKFEHTCLSEIDLE